MKRFFWILGLCILAFSVAAQTGACPPIVYDAMLQTSDFCSAMGRNQVCYGSTAIEVQPRGDAQLDFTEPGDLSAVRDVASIQTSPLDEANGEFGIALMQLQANMPNVIPGQVVTFLLMGDIALTDVSGEGQRPMEAFQFRTGIGQPSCSDVNLDTLVIDSPDGLTVSFNVNGVDVELGSTAVLVGKPDNLIDMLVVEGEGLVTANGESVTVPSGQWTQIEMDAETGVNAVSTPAAPTDFPPERIAHIPFDLLNVGQNVALGKPVTADSFLETDPPENVVNGLTTGADNWNAGSPPPHWIEIDLLRNYPVSQIRMQTSQFPEAQFDPTVHRILVRGSQENDYREVHVFDGETRDDQWLEFTPDTPVPNVRYVRVESVSSIHWASWGEIEVYSAGFQGCLLIANVNANLRAGAGTDTDIVGSVNRGESGTALAGSVGSDGMNWWQWSDGAWIREDLVDTQGLCQFVPAIDS